MPIRLLTENETKQLSDKLQSLSKEDLRYFNPHSFDIETVKRLPSINEHWFYSLVVDDYNVGYGMIRKWDGFRAPTIGYVIWPEHRGKGYGNLIVEELVKEAHRLGFNAVKASVHWDNKASIATLRKRGFGFMGQVEEGIEKDYLWFGLSERRPD